MMYQEDGVKRWLLDHQIELGLDVTSKPNVFQSPVCFQVKRHNRNESEALVYTFCIEKYISL